ncbi:HAD-IIIC family phosphatase [Vibrio mangrovi]|uniref:HAD-IIIC family phosphatase n=1 Tax=Vibrio mangrovi TaxID=474394 RepID=A0A1Y6J083_9VIBR|nr:HAD-IIIC family phosphatase [Vibrio mangrovi]MDW6005408.1 HAD-IIIC family phosphatase [Vibrio mangrovi]SMS02152.1 Polyketide synthase PksJ [Vibrio mangrovi]
MFYPDMDDFPTLGQRLTLHAKERPNQIAYRFLSESGEEIEHLTYASLKSQAINSAQLICQHTQSRKRVLLLLPTGREYIVALWACLFAGVIAVPLSRPVGKRMLHRLQNIAIDTQPDLIITEEKWLPHLSVLSRQNPAIMPVQIITCEQLRAYGETPQARCTTDTLPDVSPDMPAVIQYSSGTTDVEKGVVLTHRNIAVNQYQISQKFRILPEDKIVSWLPLHHDMGLMGCVFQSLYAGATCILLSPESFSKQPFLWLQTISRFQASISGAPDFAYRLCLSLPTWQIEQLDLSSWRIAFNGAEPVRYDTLTRFSRLLSPQGFRQAAFAPCYGMAEATLLVAIDASDSAFHTLQLDREALQQNQIVICDHESRDSGINDEDIVSNYVVSCGTVCEHLDLSIVIPGTSKPASELEVGEILIAGDNVTQGYWGNIDTDRITFPHHRNGYLRTGDLGFVYAGELYITGRVKDLMIIHGRNYYPADIEYTLIEQIATVNRAVVWCEPSDVAGEIDAGLTVIIETSRKLDVGPLFSQVKRVIGMQYELTVERIIVTCKGGIPVTTSGKVKRWQCQEWLEQKLFKVVADSREVLPDSPALSQKEPIISMDAVTVSVHEVLQHILHLPAIENEQHFFEMGGTSLKASLAVAELEKKLNQPIRLEWLLHSDSICDFIASIRQYQQQASSSTLLCITDVARKRATDRKLHEHYPLSLAQKRMWILEQLHPGNPFYITATETTLNQPLDYQAFYQAGQILLQKHEILRARFHDESDSFNGITHQSFSSQAVFNCSFIRLDQDSPDNQPDRLKNIINSQVLKPFDFSNEDAFRAVVIALTKTHYKIYLVTHHLVCDGYALSLLFQELRSLYQQLLIKRGKTEQTDGCPEMVDLSGDLPDLVPLPVQYRDYVQWQQLMMECTDFWSEHENYWHTRYAQPLPERLNIADFPISEHGSTQASPFSRGSEFTITLPVDLSRRLSDLAHERKMSLFILMLTALKVLVSLRSGQQDVVIGTAVSGRDQAELSDMIGCFINFLPLRTEIHLTDTWDELLAKVNSTVVGAIEHQAYPYEKLHEYIQQVNHKMSGSEGGLSVYSVGFWFHDYAVPALLPDSHSKLLPTDSASLDLRVVVIERGEELDLTFEYIPQRLKVQTVENLSATYVALLNRLIDQQDQPVQSSEGNSLMSFQAKESQPEMTVQLLSSFNAAPIGKILPYIFSQIGLGAKINLHASSFLFDQVLTHQNSLVQNLEDIHVFLFRPEDWFDKQRILTSDVSTLVEQSVVIIQSLIAALTDFAEMVHAPVYVGLCETTVDSLSGHHQWQQYIHRIQTQLSHCSVLNLLPLHLDKTAFAEAIERDTGFGLSDDGLPEFPYKDSGYADISKVIARSVYAQQKVQRKVIVVDCDNTLWDGSCAEDGWENIRITPARKRIQTFLLEMKQRGYLLAICSHNLFSDVQQVFEHHHEMLLSWDDFVATRIDWQPKSAGLVSLADEFNLGIDSFILIDDSAINCTLVRENCPEVFVLELPENGEIAAEQLLGSWEFDRIEQSGESDLSRTQQYHDNRQRMTLRHQVARLDEFLHNIEQRIDISEVDDVHRPHQLCLRVNQFNTSYQRFSISQLQRMVESSHYILKKVCVSDRFGDMGEVGFFIARPQNQQLIIESFLLSCRALGRTVEVAMLEDLLRIATERGLETLTLRVMRKARNEPARIFAARYFGLSKSFGLSESDEFSECENGELSRFELSRTLEEIRSDLAAISDSEITQQNDLHISTLKYRPMTTSEIVPLADATQLFTVKYQSSELLAEEVFSQTAVLPASGQSEYVPPQTDMERMLADIWQNILGCESPGIQDNFFAAGYNSLEATRVIARIRKQTGIAMNQADLLEFPTIFMLAQHIENKLKQWADSETHQQLLEQAALLSDDELDALLYQDE